MSFLNKAKQFKNLHKEMKKTQAVLSAEIVKGTSSGDLVVIELNAAMEVKSIKIDPKVFEKPESAYMEKLIKEALSTALRKAQKVASAKLSQLGNLGGLNPFA